MLKSEVPRFNPATETRLLSIAMFVDDTEETAPASYDATAVREPIRSLDVIFIRAVPYAPEAVEHTIVLADVHRVASHALPPRRSFALWSAQPIDEPCTVMDVSSDTMLLGLTNDREGSWKERTSVVELTTLPTVRATPSVAPAPRACLQVVSLSDSHVVASQVLAPVLAVPLSAKCPIPVPMMVSDRATAATFDGNKSETRDAS